MDVFDVLSALQALSDPTRFAVFECIRGCGGASAYDTDSGECDAGESGAAAICDVKCRVPCVPSTLSHHLNVLREAGLIVTERKGRRVYARIVPGAMSELTAFFQSSHVPLMAVASEK